VVEDVGLAGAVVVVLDVVVVVARAVVVVVVVDVVVVVVVGADDDAVEPVARAPVHPTVNTAHAPRIQTDRPTAADGRRGPSRDRGLPVGRQRRPRAGRRQRLRRMTRTVALQGPRPTAFLAATRKRWRVPSVRPPRMRVVLVDTPSLTVLHVVPPTRRWMT
jgi:hypothetical protein